ncbi:MAG: hypothetical protein IJH52_03010, partial [Oscillospiraceae bacterium]|nr:hypothetical protein [Oscillospiraceae bacterium]
DWPDWAPEQLVAAMRARGAELPWSHQTEGAEAARAGEHVVVATGTASGKSMIYQLPVLAKNVKLYLSDRFVIGHTYPNGDPIAPDYYDFDADGKMVVQNGPVGDYFYVNGVRQNAYKLVEYNGDYYFINDGHKLAKNVTLYLSSRYVDGKTLPDGSVLSVGYYHFDADGKMVLN